MHQRISFTAAAVTIAAISLAGCTEMQVRKITPQLQAQGRADNVKGFRYYLSRPYVVVKAPIEVSRRTSLIVVDAKEGFGQALLSQGTVATSSLASTNDSSTLRIPVGKISRVSEQDGSVHQLTAAEWSVLRSQIQAVSMQTGGTADAQNQAPPQLQLQQQQQQQQPPPWQLVITPTPGAVLPKPNAGAGPRGEALTQEGLTPGGAPLGQAPTGGATSNPGSNTGTGTQSQSQQSTATGGNTALADAPKPIPSPGPSNSLKGNIDIFFLPDLDEQYAVHNCNFLSKSAYSLQFRNGWELVSVSGVFDSTPVAIEILNVLQSAIQAAEQVASAELPLEFPASAAGGPKGVAPVEPPKPATSYAVLQVTHVTCLRPGVYRVNKPWETNGTQTPIGYGLLSQLGIPTMTFTSVTKADPVKLSDLEAECLASQSSSQAPMTAKPKQ